MSDDIVERLKSVAKAGGTGWEDEQDETVRRFISDAAWAVKDAADEIGRLSEDNINMRAAIEEQKRENRALRERMKTAHDQVCNRMQCGLEEDSNCPRCIALRALDGEGE